MAETNDSTTIKRLGEDGIKAIGKYAKDQASAAKTAAVTEANSYTDVQIEAKKYTLPAATTNVLGGVKGGGTGISIAADGTISATGTAAVDPSALPLASKTQKGAVIIGDGIEMVDGKITVSHPDVYTKTEADGKFQTAAQVESIASAKVAEIVDGAPDSLDTLKEIADTLNKDTEGGIVNSLLTEIGKKANSADVPTTTAMTQAINAAKNELNTEIAKKATPTDVSTAKTEAIEAASTAAAELYQPIGDYALASDVPIFVEYTATEINTILASIE